MVTWSNTVQWKIIGGLQWNIVICIPVLYFSIFMDNQFQGMGANLFITFAAL